MSGLTWTCGILAAVVLIAAEYHAISRHRRDQQDRDAAGRDGTRPRHPSRRLRPVPLEKDGRPLTEFEQRELGRIEMAAMIGMPEVKYLGTLRDSLADGYRRLGPPPRGQR